MKSADSTDSDSYPIVSVRVASPPSASSASSASASQPSTKSAKAPAGTTVAATLTVSTSSASSSAEQVEQDASSGRIKVFVRVRPLLPPEIAAREPTVILTDADAGQIAILDTPAPPPAAAGPSSGTATPTRQGSISGPSGAGSALSMPHSSSPSPAPSAASGHSQSSASAGHSYTFDQVFPASATNRDVYHSVCMPLVEACLRGFNGTLVAYGQTGTGKTTTLSSPDGMIPRALRHLFRRMHRDRYRCTYKVRLSYMQIYQEKIYDLLGGDTALDARLATTASPGHDPSSPLAFAGQDLPLREHPDLGIFVEGLSEHHVRTEADVLALLARGQQRLVFAETKMNRHSSRSHAICFLTVERHPGRQTAPGAASGIIVPGSLSVSGSRTSFSSLSGLAAKSTDGLSVSPSRLGFGRSASRAAAHDQFTPLADIDESGGTGADPLSDAEWGADEPLFNPDASAGGTVATTGDAVLRGRLTLCDLAGSERVKKTNATGTQLSEAKEINLSLLELGNVIQALAEQKKHVPFRNSTLTRLLQESLGGNCLTSLIVCVSPTRRDISETKGTLMFGWRAMRVKTHARINVEIDHEKRANELAEQLALKEAEWAEKERMYKHQLEQLRLTLLNSSDPTSSTTLYVPVSSSKPGMASQQQHQLEDALLQERTRYRAALDAFTTTVEQIMSTASAVRALVDREVAVARLVSHLTLAPPASATLPTSGKRSRSASPSGGGGAAGLSTNIRRLQQLYQPTDTSPTGTAQTSRGLGDAIDLVLDPDRDAAANELVAVAASDDPLVESALISAAPQSAREAVQVAMDEVRRLALARFESLAQVGRPAASRMAREQTSREQLALIAATVAADGAGPRRSRNPTRVWAAQLAAVAAALTALNEPALVIRSASGADADGLIDDVAVAAAAARQSLGAMATAMAALQALNAQSALAHAALGMDAERMGRVVGRVVSEWDKVEWAVGRAEAQVGIEGQVGQGLADRLDKVLEAAVGQRGTVAGNEKRGLPNGVRNRPATRRARYGSSEVEPTVASEYEDTADELDDLDDEDMDEEDRMSALDGDGTSKVAISKPKDKSHGGSGTRECGSGSKCDIQ